jgi:exportin-7
MGDMMQLMNNIVNKLCNNVKYWHKQDKILEETLEVFVELVASYSSSKTLLNLETVNFLVHNHVGAHFPFLGYDSDNKYRITFYAALSRLVFSSSEDLNNSFDTFMAPNLVILTQLSQTQDLRPAPIKTAIIAALRDLRGITTSSYNKRTYNLLFDALYPTYFTLFQRIAEVWYDDPNVMTALLKFMQEFVANKSQRIAFENSSANGILLFRETSRIISTYGSRILQLPVQQDIYLEKYKGIRLMLNTLTNALSGNYVNFGVFSLYNDQALQNALDVSLQMCLQIPLNDIMAYVKLSRAYFAYLEILYRNHLDVLSGLDSNVFIQLIKTNIEGLQSSGKYLIFFFFFYFHLLIVFFY